MADVRHSMLTGPDLHEPKGISDAVAGEVYVANGVGTGNMKQIAKDGTANETLMEPKGTSDASAGQAYYADGAGSGTWSYKKCQCYGAMRFVNQPATDFNGILETCRLITGAGLLTPAQLWYFGQHGQGVTFKNDDNNERLQVTLPGDYWVSMTISASGRISDARWDFGIAVNGIRIGNGAVTLLTPSAQDAHSASISGIISLNANDTVQVCGMNTDNSNDINLKSGILAINLINATV